MSQREVVAWMETYDIVVVFFDMSGLWELHILAYPVEYGDFDDMNGIGLQQQCSATAYGYTDQGWAVAACEPYRAPEGHQFVMVEASYDDAEALLEYQTIRSGYMVSIYSIGYMAEVSDSQRDAAQAVADSLWIKPVQ